MFLLDICGSVLDLGGVSDDSPIVHVGRFAPHSVAPTECGADIRIGSLARYVV